jgi:GNAT superfamily N-acetyltransferase
MANIPPVTPDVRYERRSDIDSPALQALFAAAWGSPKPGYEVVFEHSFTWVTAWEGDELVGFANVAWDGDTHFFLLDTTVHPDRQRRGIGRRLVEEAIAACRGHGEWLHVDADEELMTGFYLRCGFQSTPAGILDVTKAGTT